MTSLPPPTPGDAGPPPPPSFPSYPTAATEYDVVGSFRRLGGLAKAMLILLVISLGLQIVQLPVILAMSGRADDFLAGTISEDSYQDALDRQAALSFPLSAVQTALVVLTMIWMFRLAQNHRALGRPNSTWGPGWAIAGWFVPPGAVYAVPWLMFRELWKGSDPANVPGDPAWKSRHVSPLLQVWWVTYGLLPVIGIFTGVADAFDLLQGADLDDVARTASDRMILEFGLALVGLVATAVYALIVRELTKRQQHLIGEN